MRVDWHHVFSDFVELGVTGDQLAERLGIRLGAIAKFADGTKKPPPAVASRATLLWSHLTGKPAKFIHQTDASEGLSVGQVEGLTSNEEREPAFAQLQSIVTVWAQVTRKHHP